MFFALLSSAGETKKTLSIKNIFSGAHYGHISYQGYSQYQLPSLSISLENETWVNVQLVYCI